MFGDYTVQIWHSISLLCSSVTEMSDFTNAQLVSHPENILNSQESLRFLAHDAQLALTGANTVSPSSHYLMP